MKLIQLLSLTFFFFALSACSSLHHSSCSKTGQHAQSCSKGKCQKNKSCHKKKCHKCGKSKSACKSQGCAPTKA